MVQIGNFHVGRYDTAQPPTLTVGEAYSLWDNLVARYDWEDTLAIFYNYAHDSELQDLLQKEIKLLRKQSATIEEQLALYQIPLPPRPREITKFQTDSGVVKDDFIFRRFFSGFQDFLSICSVAVRNCVVNDSLRGLFIKLLLEKIDVSASPKSPKADKVACPDIARYNDHIKAKEKGCLLFA